MYDQYIIPVKEAWATITRESATSKVTGALKWVVCGTRGLRMMSITASDRLATEASNFVDSTLRLATSLNPRPNSDSQLVRVHRTSRQSSATSCAIIRSEKSFLLTYPLHTTTDSLATTRAQRHMRSRGGTRVPHRHCGRRGGHVGRFVI